jgi:hypothetical protein
VPASSNLVLPDRALFPCSLALPLPPPPKIPKHLKPCQPASFIQIACTHDLSLSLLCLSIISITLQPHLNLHHTPPTVYIPSHPITSYLIGERLRIRHTENHLHCCAVQSLPSCPSSWRLHLFETLKKGPLRRLPLSVCFESTCICLSTSCDPSRQAATVLDITLPLFPRPSLGSRPSSHRPVCKKKGITALLLRPREAIIVLSNPSTPIQPPPAANCLLDAANRIYKPLV